MKVTLREKKLLHGRISLYLDFYPALINPETGEKTRRDFLKLYVYQKPKTEIERNHNKETKLLAVHICAQRQLEIQAGNYGFLTKSGRNEDFLVYFKKVAEKHNTSESTRNTWHAAYRYLSNYCKDQCTFERVNQEFVEGFKDYLLTCETLRSPRKKLSANSGNTYFTCFLAVIKDAVREKKFSENPAAEVKNIPTEDGEREFLTLEELHKVAETHCDMPDTLRRAALFSALTGMRFSDIQDLKWEAVHHSKETGHFIRSEVLKTHIKSSTKFISDEARDLLGETGSIGSLVFHNLDYGSMTSVYIGRWMLAAGITKTITFHCFRHTFATAQLTMGTDLWTVQKMLDHKTIKNTQRYARIIDQKKLEAAGKISLKGGHNK